MDEDEVVLEGEPMELRPQLPGMMEIKSSQLFRF